MSDTPLWQGPLPVGTVQRKGVGWYGLLCLIASEAALFGYLLFSYYYFVVQQDRSWFPAELPQFRLSLPNTIILILSSVAAWWATRGLRRGKRTELIAGLALAFLLGAVFMAIQFMEWGSKHFSLRSSPYGSLYFTVTGFHLAHVAAGLVTLLILLICAVLGYFDPRRNSPLLIGTTYWHFVDAVWITVFFTFYVTPYFW